MVYVVNSRIPVYRAYYGDGLGNTIMGLFSRAAPKIAPFAKEAGMKAIDIIRDKGLGVIGDLAGRAFSTVKDKIVSLTKSRFSRKKPQIQPLPSTELMPANVNKIINNAVKEKLESIISAEDNNISNLIAGSGLGRTSKKIKNY